MSEFTIVGATVYLPDDVAQTNVTIADGRIAEIGGSVRGAPLLARGQILAPAMIDVHGDAFERQLMPRPNLIFPIETAILETDRQLAANGIATAYHALTLSWEPGLRSVKTGEAFIDALDRIAQRLAVENRVQLRWETFCFEALPLIERALQNDRTPSLAFNDHTSMAMLDSAVDLQNRPFEFDPGFPVGEVTGRRFVQIAEGRAKRAGLTPDEFTRKLLSVWERRDQVQSTIARVAKFAKDAKAPMLSHDDSQIETRDYYRSKGARTSEFPMRVPVAEAARAAGDTIVFGAPNAARGGSHLGSSPGAGDMIEAGLCDALASDYYYPAMLSALARLDQEQRMSRKELWRLVSAGPARAMGLHDRGSIIEGNRADLVLVDWPKDQQPAIRRTIIKGRTAFLSEPAGAV